MLPGQSSEGGSLAALGEALRGAVVPELRRARSPPTIEAWVGDRPRSFPLQLRHAGRCETGPHVSGVQVNDCVPSLLEGWTYWGT